jgi:uncharacterized membrane protein
MFIIAAQNFFYIFVSCKQWISLCSIPAKINSEIWSVSGDSLDIIGILLSLLRAILGLILLFFIPGFAFTWAIYTKMTDLSLVARIAISCVLSIAIVMLSSLFLDFALGIETTGLNVTIMLLILSLFFTILYVARVILDQYGLKNTSNGE